MKIGLDATRILLPTGEGTYTREFIRHVIRRFHHDHQFHIVIPEIEKDFNIPNVKQHLYPEVDGVLGRIRYAFEVPKRLANEDIEIYHNLTNYGLIGYPFKMVTTIHDLMTLKYPELRSSKSHWYIYRFVIPFFLRRADAIITDSKSTESDLSQLYNIRSNVNTIYCGFNRDIFQATGGDDELKLSAYNLSPGYLLFVGYIIPKKNLSLIFRAMKLLEQQHNMRPYLVIAGKRGYGAESIFREAQDLALEDRIAELGYVPDDDLPALYRNAKLFLFPSRYEGFGLPALEAMACGTPALVSSAGSLPEIVGSKEYTCSPEDPAELALKIRNLYDPNHYQRARRWSLDQSSNFSWNTCAEEAMKIYLKLCQ